MQIFYADTFALPLPAGHRFPVAKYRQLRERLRDLARPELRFDEAPRIEFELLLRVHDADYVARVCEGRLSAPELRAIGFPWSEGFVERALRSVGATWSACRTAIADGCSITLAGGTHHADAARGGGYCVFNDAAVATRALQAAGQVGRVLIVDCDVHQGDGTARIFDGDPSVFTLSLHGARNYPFRKARSTLDREFADGTGDADYLAGLSRCLEEVDGRFAPDLVIYLAGADPFAGDVLGRLALSIDGLLERDHRVLRFCQDRRIPVAICMAGGYADPIDDTVTIHANTVCLAADLFSRQGRPAAIDDHPA
jgi:acetoin utilization deacetylase AcuC-like enzyme